MKILLIEDNTALCDTIKSQLSKEGHIIDVCHSGDEGLIFAINEAEVMILLSLTECSLLLMVLQLLKQCVKNRYRFQLLS